jgi:hypothetical protein
VTIIQAEKKIRNAWIVGLICGFLTLFVALVEVTSGGGAIDVFSTLLIFAFTVGIYMKNRVAAGHSHTAPAAGRGPRRQHHTMT